MISLPNDTTLFQQILSHFNTTEVVVDKFLLSMGVVSIDYFKFSFIKFRVGAAPVR